MILSRLLLQLLITVEPSHPTTAIGSGFES
jgi:hypothetical protein